MLCSLECNSMMNFLWSTSKSCKSASIWFETLNIVDHNILELITRCWHPRLRWLTFEPRLISSTSYDHSCVTSFLTANIQRSVSGMMCDTSSERFIQGQFKSIIKLLGYWVFIGKNACYIWILSKLLAKIAVPCSFCTHYSLFFNWNTNTPN